MDNSNTSLLRFPRHIIDQITAHLRSQSPATSALTATATTLGLLAAWVIRDYQQWKSFGTGGTPPTPAGYWRMTKLRISAAFSSDKMTDASSLSTEGPSYLNIWLPNRSATRPKIMGRTMPQRQVPTPLPSEVKSQLHSLCKRFCQENPSILKLDLSATEGRSTDAIYALPSLPNRPAAATDRILKDEIAHCHPSEDSLHVWLSEPDARKVVEAGWGERFPLSAMGMCHRGWTFVYAPRGSHAEEDLDGIEEIVKAGVAFVTGERI